MKRFAIFQSLLLFTLFSGAAWAQNITAEEVVSVKPYAEQSQAILQQPVRVALELDILENWHIYAPGDEEAFTIPTEVTMQPVEGVTLGEWEFPEPAMLSVAGIDEPAAVYGGRITLFNTVTVTNPDLAGVTIQGGVSYQACDDRTCLIPVEIPFQISLEIVPLGTAIEPQHPAIFSEAAQSEVVAGGETVSGTLDSDNIAGLVDDKGLFLTFLLIFLGGLALNLTPCVYPLIPITVSFFGGRDTSRGKTFQAALAYVLGIAITYSILGVVAASTGALFGSLLTNPIVLIGIAVLLVALSLSMFGVYEFRLPSGLMLAAGQSRSGVLGALFMGLTLGIVAAPCVGPFVIGLLTYVAQLQSVVLGFWMFFILALGLGLPYLFLAMFSSRIHNLPRSGAWMVGVRVIFGLILIGMAVYFILPLLGDAGNWIFGGFIFASGFYLIVIDKNGRDARLFVTLKNVIGIVAIVISTWLLLPGKTVQATGEVDWQKPTTMEAFNAALETEKPVLLDFYADWCIPCREMDNFTFTDPRVIEQVKAFKLIKIDLTTAKGEYEQALQKRYAVKGVPTYVFLSPNGEELTSLRLTGFEKADEFLTRLRQASGH
ncbi:MAG: thioredoxin family protein [Candidatus Marinimicrobia bacterium]|nr:thioredoxin family protein [Candidatus Neomarinimicrobiota bacterium]MCF7840056.1 thioredoxin family protein [Candidatus Neomarinimicrobiota bacterium]MCF7902416.1 thioredoxin family protein [Candidatus Neomarinimicrobiota bacterium]